jgi:sulfite dehydrogenase (quinone) subunit SoeC
VALVAAWSVKLAWRNRMLNRRPISTPETATGLGSIGRVRLVESPHSGENYLTREMGFRVARKHAVKLAVLSLLLGGLVPALLIAIAVFSAGSVAVAAGLVAVLMHAAGMLVERWLFFAEARHAVMNYY